MKHKVVTASEAIALLRDGDTLVNTGFVGCGAPEDLLVTLEQRFLETGTPRNLTLLFAAGQGDGAERGLNRLGHDGLLKRVVGGHWGLIPKVAKLALANRIEGYNLPQGVISQLYRAIACREARRYHQGRPEDVRRSQARGRQDQRDQHGRPGRTDRAGRRGMALLQVLPDQRRVLPGHHRRPERQCDDGEGGADHRQPGDGDGGEELRRPGHRPGRAHRRGGLAQSEAGQDPGNPRRLRRRRAAGVPRADLWPILRPVVRGADQSAARLAAGAAARRAQADRPALRLRAAAGRRRQSRHRHARGPGLGRQRGADPDGT